MAPQPGPRPLSRSGGWALHWGDLALDVILRMVQVTEATLGRLAYHNVRRNDLRGFPFAPLCAAWSVRQMG